MTVVVTFLCGDEGKAGFIGMMDGALLCETPPPLTSQTAAEVSLKLLKFTPTVVLPMQSCCRAYFTQYSYKCISA